MASEQFSLCWDNFHKNMSSGMNTLLENEDLVDVTLAVEGKYLKAHKMVLSVCSPYFKDLFKMNPCKHPIVFMKDVSYVAMSDLLQFMYQGEVQVSQENLTTFIKTAEALQIKGLTGDGNGATDCDNENQEESRPAPIEEIKFAPMRQRKIQQHSAVLPPPKRQRTSAPSESSTSSSLLPSTLTKTEASTSSATPTNEQIIQFKMEPFDQSHSVTVPDDNADETFADDPLDDTNADDTNDDYSMMEGGVEEPQAGTSTDGMAGEGQGPYTFDAGLLHTVKIVECRPISGDEIDDGCPSTANAPESPTLTTHPNKTPEWNDVATKILLDCHELFLAEVGPMKKYKRKKDMWKEIGKIIENTLGFKFTYIQVENRYKTISKRKRAKGNFSYREGLVKIAPANDSPQHGDGEKDTSGNTTLKKQETAEEVLLQKMIEEKEEAKERRHKEKLELIRQIFSK